MTTVPLNPPSERDDLVSVHEYVAERFAEYDRAQAAIAQLHSAYRKFGAALAEAGAAMDNIKVYNPEEWFEKAPRLTPADLSIPGRVVQFITHDPEHFLEAGVMLGALHHELFQLTEKVEGDVQTLTRQLRDADEEVTA